MSKHRTPTTTALRSSALRFLDHAAEAIRSGEDRPSMAIGSPRAALSDDEWELNRMAIDIILTSVVRGIDLPDPGFTNFDDPADYATYLLACRRVIGAVTLEEDMWDLLSAESGKLAANRLLAASVEVSPPSQAEADEVIGALSDLSDAIRQDMEFEAALDLIEVVVSSISSA